MYIVELSWAFIGPGDVIVTACAYSNYNWYDSSQKTVLYPRLTLNQSIYSISSSLSNFYARRRLHLAPEISASLPQYTSDEYAWASENVHALHISHIIELLSLVHVQHILVFTLYIIFNSQSCFTNIFVNHSLIRYFGKAKGCYKTRRVNPVD